LRWPALTSTPNAHSLSSSQQIRNTSPGRAGTGSLKVRIEIRSQPDYQDYLELRMFVTCCGTTALIDVRLARGFVCAAGNMRPDGAELTSPDIGISLPMCPDSVSRH